MMNKYLVGGLLGLLGCTGLVLAQPELGAPIISKDRGCESAYGPSFQVPSSANTGACRVDCKPKPKHPVFDRIARTMMTPIHAAGGNLQPSRTEDAPAKEPVAPSIVIVAGGNSPAEMAAATIKFDESQARARQAAVKYLALIDCRYYPEAEAGLIAALREDRSEMVRYEAAFSLGGGRSLTIKMLDALNMTALGLDLDGHPAEGSAQVRNAARASLQRCSARGLCLPPLSELAIAEKSWQSPEWNPLQPTSHAVPTFLPTTPPVSQRERDVAATISAPSKSVQVSPSSSTREMPRGTRGAEDPRLRGLRPLGADAGLAIPMSPPAAIVPQSPYNYRN